MIPEAPFVFSIAGLSASFAGLAGLVLGLRRGTELRPVDALRLREIVAFSFANILFSVSIVPLSLLLPGGTADAVRVAAAVAVFYVVGSTAYLGRQTRQVGIGWTRGWAAAVLMLLGPTVVVAAFAFFAAVMPAYEGLLVLLLARPMLAFLLVLTSLEASAEGR